MRHHLFTIAVEGDETSSRLVFAESANQAVRLYFAHHRITKSDREILAYYSERTIFILPASQESDLPGVVQREHERKEVRFFNHAGWRRPQTSGEKVRGHERGTNESERLRSTPASRGGRAGHVSTSPETQPGACRAEARRLPAGDYYHGGISVGFLLGFPSWAPCRPSRDPSGQAARTRSSAPTSAAPTGIPGARRPFQKVVHAAGAAWSSATWISTTPSQGTRTWPARAASPGRTIAR